MSVKQIIILVSIGAINVLLNYALLKTSKVSPNFICCLMSKEFLVAMTIGIVSTTAIVFVYKTNINLGQGIILMGASSIIIGVFFSTFYLGDKLNNMELLIFFFLLIFYIARFFK